MREYNNGQWTQAKFNAFVKSILRSGSKRWPPKYACLAGAYSGQRVNPASGRMAKFYECAGCGGSFVAKNVQVDHIEPVVPLTGFTTWDDVIDRMFCESSNFQCLCLSCHKNKTASERKLAKELRKNNE